MRKNTILTLFHLSVALFDAFTLWYDQNYVTVPLNDVMKERIKLVPLRGRPVFLTIWCLVIQTTYFTLAFLNDVFGTNAGTPKKPPVIRIIKDTLFSLALPLALLVGMCFWGVYAYDKDVILPENIRKALPTWMNHSMHTTIVFFIILELFLSPITYPTKIVGLSLGVTFALSYISLLVVCYIKAGTLIYPFLDMMSVPQKIGFVTISTLIGFTFYFIGEMLNGFLNPVGRKSTGSVKEKSKKVT
ncbi:androgen-dependent TFPI-regulating protein-like [Pectinophora gossypiella]|uniref:androgen-dependent TFPI-regulating protein-like n=1 Tax=Pectinophora gossypiella TaxID=13191 RepID=UPI00214E8903|nr:androgen-dependent TFPI-regulating protein-like [Pectinophora gossypiella]